MKPTPFICPRTAARCSDVLARDRRQVVGSVVCRLGDGQLRFNELRRAIGGISPAHADADAARPGTRRPDHAHGLPPTIPPAGAFYALDRARPRFAQSGVGARRPGRSATSRRSPAHANSSTRRCAKARAKRRRESGAIAQWACPVRSPRHRSSSANNARASDWPGSGPRRGKRPCAFTTTVTPT